MSELETVEAWAKGLEQLGQRIGARFTRAEPRQRAVAYLKGLMSDIPRKNGWQLAEFAGEATPDGMQRLFDFIETLVKWESTTDETVLNTARELIKLSTGGNPPPTVNRSVS